MCTSDVFLGLLAILFPPIAVWIKRGVCSADSLINIALCMLGFIPGLLHAWYIIALYPEERDDYDALQGDGGENGSGRVTYYYVDRREVSGEDRESGGRSVGGQGRGYGAITEGGMNAKAKANQKTKVDIKANPDVSQGPVGRGEGASEGAGEGVPPSYEQAVRGDHKIQT